VWAAVDDVCHYDNLLCRLEALSFPGIQRAIPGRDKAFVLQQNRLLMATLLWSQAHQTVGTRAETIYAMARAAQIADEAAGRRADHGKLPAAGLQACPPAPAQQAVLTSTQASASACVAADTNAGASTSASGALQPLQGLDPGNGGLCAAESSELGRYAPLQHNQPFDTCGCRCCFVQAALKRKSSMGGRCLPADGVWHCRAMQTSTFVYA
jgi:hypothetical protein